MSARATHARDKAQRDEALFLRRKCQELIAEHPAFERGREAALLEVLEEIEADLKQLRLEQARDVRTEPALFATIVITRLRRKLGRPV